MGALGSPVVPLHDTGPESDSPRETRLDGLTWSGRKLKCQRPSQTMEPSNVVSHLSGREDYGFRRDSKTALWTWLLVSDTLQLG